MSRIVGISGKAGSGKDTIADMLVAKGYVRIAFADEIKRTAIRWWGFETNQMFGPSERRLEPPPGRSGPTARAAGQQIGTEVARALDSNLWVDLCLEAARAVADGLPTIVDAHYSYTAERGLYVEPGRERRRIRGVAIPDMRFLNEVERVKAEGGILLRVKRAGAGLTGEAARHRSELEQDSIPDSAFDSVIDNDGSLLDLEATVDRIVAKLDL